MPQYWQGGGKGSQNIGPVGMGVYSNPVPTWGGQPGTPWAPVMTPRTNTGANYQDFPRAVSPWQQALQGQMGNTGMTQHGFGPNQQGLAAFSHPFANAAIAGDPWKNPALHKDIKAYEQRLNKAKAGGVDRQTLSQARAKLQREARMAGRDKPTGGDVFQGVLRDMIQQMLQGAQT